MKAVVIYLRALIAEKLYAAAAKEMMLFLTSGDVQGFRFHMGTTRFWADPDEDGTEASIFGATRLNGRRFFFMADSKGGQGEDREFAADLDSGKLPDEAMAKALRHEIIEPAVKCVTHWLETADGRGWVKRRRQTDVLEYAIETLRDGDEFAVQSVFRELGDELSGVGYGRLAGKLLTLEKEVKQTVREARTELRRVCSEGGRRAAN